MNSLTLAINKIFKGAAKSFYRFPASIASAIVLSITLIVKITMEWELQQKYNLLFSSIQMSLIFSAVFSMAAVALYEVKRDKNKSFFALVNISAIVLSVLSFLLLYFYGGKTLDDKVIYLSSIATSRAMVAIFISIVAFIYIISKSKAINSFSDSFFITHKAFVVSAIYGIVIMAGVSGVLGAFQALVYRSMHYSIYQYLGVAVGFLTYTMFLGYFPSFKDMEDIEEVKRIKEQPRFIFVLFGYILIPIIMALTVVLLIWCIMMLFRGLDSSFNRLSSITSSYVVIGIWLHIMVSKHQSKTAEFYKKSYPFAGILILVFEAWALFVQLNRFGLRTTEYSFLMIWIFAAISVSLLIFLKEKSYRKIAITAIVISLIWVLPIIGYHDITFNSQLNRLEKILIDEELLVNESIVASDKEIEYVRRGEITETVDFISYSEKSKKPNWFKKDLDDDKVFKDTFGFEKTYGVYEEPEEYSSANYALRTEVIDISDYSLSLNMILDESTEKFKAFEYENARYEVEMLYETMKAPKIIVKLEDKIIIEKDLDKYISDLLIKYPKEGNRTTKIDFEDMNVTVEYENISMLFVFNNIDIYFDNTENTTEYHIDLHGIYIK